MSVRDRMEKLIRAKQLEIVRAMEALETPVSAKSFLLDKWTRDDPTEGGGISAVIQNGAVIEKGAANISVIHGHLPPAAIASMRADHSTLVTPQDGALTPFSVCGLSMIMHPKNPKAPTTHLNYRYFEVQNPDGSPQAWWFGGGADLTPHYLYEEDAELFHREHKAACDAVDPAYYPRFKTWCDEYFYLPHRQEGRGIGGIFFDDLSDRSPEDLLRLCEGSFDAFLRSYPLILFRRVNLPFTDAELRWQQIRRGRYVEFNLMYDRGTKFGLVTPNARIESILVSLPQHVSWEYMHAPDKGSVEEKTLEVLKHPRQWV